MSEQRGEQAAVPVRLITFNTHHGVGGDERHDLPRLAKVLAEPTLVAMSGQEAKFLAGGEFPFPVPEDHQPRTPR